MNNINNTKIRKTVTQNPKVNTIKTQQGASLIMVLLVIVMVALIGTYALKKSSTDLTISTSAQVRTLSFQSSDLGVAKFEKVIGRGGKLENTDGPIGLIHYSSYPEEVELAFCIDDRKKDFFNVNRVSKRLRYSGGHENSFDRGYCDPSSAFVSKRGASADQLWFRKLGRNELTTEAFGDEYVLTVDPVGENVSTAVNKSKAQYYRLTSVAFVPAFSDADSSNIEDCMKESSTASGVDNCLKELGVPYSSQEQNYQFSIEGIDTV